MGKGKDPHVEAQEHRSRPLASLKDPSTFAPPPKHVKYHGDTAESPGTPSDALESPTPSSDELREPPKDNQGEEAGAARSRPPIPYRADTTGLSTRNLPKPPSRYPNGQSSPITSAASPSPKPKPALPPRLPPRQISSPSQDVSREAPPSYSRNPSEVNHRGGPVNSGALSRLKSAGIRVPGLGIGEEPAGPNTRQDQNNSDSGSRKMTPSEEQGRQLPSLQSRFSKMSTKPSSSLASPTEVPAQGTSFAQKQAALKTASAFRNDPSSISLSDAKASAATANNFRERHGEQVAAGWQAGNALNKKYDIANKFSDRARADNDASPSRGVSDSAPSDALGSSFGIRGKAPPPVPKKPSTEGNSAPSVPPVPWSSKPKS